MKPYQPVYRKSKNDISHGQFFAWYSVKLSSVITNGILLSYFRNDYKINYTKLGLMSFFVCTINLPKAVVMNVLAKFYEHEEWLRGAIPVMKIFANTAEYIVEKDLLWQMATETGYLSDNPADNFITPYTQEHDQSMLLLSLVESSTQLMVSESFNISNPFDSLSNGPPLLHKTYKDPQNIKKTYDFEVGKSLLGIPVWLIMSSKFFAELNAAEKLGVKANDAPIYAGLSVFASLVYNSLNEAIGSYFSYDVKTAGDSSEGHN